MTAYPKETAKAAKWIWDRKHMSADWNWPVLTKRNKADDTLGYGDVLAFQIFTILESKDLIRPLKFTGKDGTLTESYEMLLADTKKWEEVQKLGSFWHQWIVTPLVEIFTNLGRAFIWLLSVIITAMVTKLLA